MKTITMTAYRRPDYALQALQALANCVGVEGYDKLIISIDPGDNRVPGSMEALVGVLHDAGKIASADIFVNKAKLGVAGNTAAALCHAFEGNESDFNVHIEDDAVLMPDALMMFDWFYDCHGGPASDYTLMSACSHQRDGYGVPKDVADDPENMSESPIITSPFAWATSRWNYPFISRTWNCKRILPTGWDWSLSFSMRLEKRRTLRPALSRCKNIGRIGGEHESPKSFDDTQLGIKYSDGSYKGPYKIVHRLLDHEVEAIDSWMVSEYELLRRESVLVDTKK